MSLEDLLIPGMIFTYHDPVNVWYHLVLSFIYRLKKLLVLSRHSLMSTFYLDDPS